MRLTQDQVKAITRLVETYKSEAQRLINEANKKLDRAAKLQENASEVLRRLAEDQARPTLQVIDGGKEE